MPIGQALTQDGGQRQEIQCPERFLPPTGSHGSRRAQNRVNEDESFCEFS